mgnify:CR=1 FL=1
MDEIKDSVKEKFQTSQSKTMNTGKYGKNRVRLFVDSGMEPESYQIIPLSLLEKELLPNLLRYDRPNDFGFFHSGQAHVETLILIAEIIMLDS